MGEGVNRVCVCVCVCVCGCVWRGKRRIEESVGWSHGIRAGCCDCCLYDVCECALLERCLCSLSLLYSAIGSCSWKHTSRLELLRVLRSSG